MEEAIDKLTFVLAMGFFSLALTGLGIITSLNRISRNN